MSALVLGRFQGVWQARIELIERAAREQSGPVLVILEGATSPPNPRSPWSANDREAMIRASVSGGTRARLRFERMREHLYLPALWERDFLAALARAGETLASVEGLYAGSEASVARLSKLRGPVTCAEPLAGGRRGAEAREAALGGDADAVSALAMGARARPARPGVLEDLGAMRAYRESWARAPFPPVFVTADAMITQAGAVLLIRRGKAPGRGLWALPGGFLDQGEWIIEGMARELREETGVVLSPSELQARIRAQAVFDFPYRSSRGRTITHGFWLDLERRPNAIASDDAADARWVPLAEIPEMEEETFEDHAQIIEALLEKGAKA